VRREASVVGVGLVAPERGEALAPGGCTRREERLGALAPAALVGVFGRCLLVVGADRRVELLVARLLGGRIGRRGSRVAAATEES